VDSISEPPPQSQHTRFDSTFREIPQTQYPMDKRRILIVDDEPGFIRLMTIMLANLDRYELRSVVDATETLEAVVKFKPHLVLLDWIMPMMNGGDVVRQIRADSRVCETRILFLSAVVLKGKEATQLAGLPAIAKPASLKELVDAIEEQMREVV
jgi:CheY-like chemotaxis protein